jgi:hypothetical protein
MHHSVCTLIQYLQQHPVQFRLLAKRAPLANISYREIELTYLGTSITMPVFDEFSDFELDSPIVYLHLVLEACEYFEDTASYTAWRKDIGIEDNPVSEKIYQQLNISAPQLRKRLLNAPQAISDYDMQFNTYIAQQLRAYKPFDEST